MSLHPKNGILIEAGFVVGRKCTNRGFADVVVRMHEAKDERPFANHAAMLIPPLARCLPDSDPSRKARRHRRGKKRRPLFGCDDAAWLRGPEVEQVSDRTLLARHAPGLVHGRAAGRRGDKPGCRDDSSAMHSIQHGFAQAPSCDSITVPEAPTTVENRKRWVLRARVVARRPINTLLGSSRHVLTDPQEISIRVTYSKLRKTVEGDSQLRHSQAVIPNSLACF
jgi:hypothetical protein